MAYTEYQYIEAPNKIDIKNKLSAFLAGGITNCEDWQTNVERRLSKFNSVTVVNPRRNDWKMDSDQIKESAIQISWEYDYIRRVSDIIFWFTDDTLQPISLFELGAALERNGENWNSDIKHQRIFLGADKNYKRRMDVVIQAKLENYIWPIRTNINELIDDFEKYHELH